MPIQLFCFGFGIKFEYLVLIGLEIDFLKSDMPVISYYCMDQYFNLKQLNSTGLCEILNNLGFKN